MSTSPHLFTYILRIADDNLVLAQRLGELVSWMPELEEDIAVANLSLDHLGQATTLYRYAAQVDGHDHDEDTLAMERDERSFLNAVLVEQPNGDFGQTMARQFFVDAYQVPFWTALQASADATLAGVAEKAAKEALYHLQYSSTWLTRLGDGTSESHRRVQAGVDAMWPFVDDLFATDIVEDELRSSGVAPDLTAVHDAFDMTVGEVLTQAKLTKPIDPYQRVGGRTGFHTEHLGPLLAVMQSVYRSHVGVAW